MNQTRHSQVKEIFFGACDLPEPQRLGFIDKACGDDQELRSEVLSLLQHDTPETLIGGLSDTNVATPHQSMAVDPESWSGRRLGNYIVTRFLAAGGMGFVLEGYDESIDRHVAIKVLHSELSGNKVIRSRFLAEARAAGRLNHPNVITIYSVEEEENASYLIMEFAERGSAEDHLKKAGPYSVSEATRIACEACSGLSAAHAVGLVHRDMKPANLLFTANGVVKITDFGIAKLTSNHSTKLTQDGQIVGTPNYMSPEQCEGKTVDVRSDIYSLGATYFSLLVGRFPYEDRGSLVSVINAHCHADPPDPRTHNPEIPTGCAAIIARAMAKQPNDRYPNIAAMLAALKDYENQTIAVPTSAETQKAPKKLSRRAALMAGSLAALVLAACSLFFAKPTLKNPKDVPLAQTEESATPTLTDAPPIQIGILHSLSGTMAQTEAAMVDACQLAIDELNEQGGLLGRRIEAQIEDGRSDEFTFAEKAESLIQSGVSTLFGCCTSASRKAVMRVVEENNHLLIYAANTEGVESSPNIVYVGGDPNQTVIPGVRWAYAFGQKRSFFLVGSDYIFPRVVNEIVKDQLESMGATLVGEEYLPLGSTQVRWVVDKIADAAPDAIINTISGDSQAAFSRELRSREIDVTQFATGMGEQELRNTDISKLVNDYSISTYFQSIDSPTNQTFVERFHNKFGSQRVVNAASESSYIGVLLWAKAVMAAGTVDPKAVREAIGNQEVNAPSGLVRIDPETHYAYRQSFIGNVEADGQFRIIWQSTAPVKPQPFPESRSTLQWQTLLKRQYDRWGGQWSAPSDATR